MPPQAPSRTRPSQRAEKCDAGSVLRSSYGFLLFADILFSFGEVFEPASQPLIRN